MTLHQLKQSIASCYCWFVATDPVKLAGVSIGCLTFNYAAEAVDPKPQVWEASPQVLLAVKSGLADVHSPFQPAIRRLLSDADKSLTVKPFSVMDKKQIPPSGDRHDYLSQAPYYWRDTNSPGGHYVGATASAIPRPPLDSLMRIV